MKLYLVYNARPERECIFVLKQNLMAALNKNYRVRFRLLPVQILVLLPEWIKLPAAGARQINEADVFLSSLRRGALPPKAETRSAAALHSRICRTRARSPTLFYIPRLKRAESRFCTVWNNWKSAPPVWRPALQRVRHLRSPIKSRTRERRRCLR